MRALASLSHTHRWFRLLIVWALLAMASANIFVTPTASAACSTPPTDYGQVTTSFTATTSGTYRIWSHMLVPTSTGTYRLEVDGAACYSVGGSSTTSPNVWSWVGYQNATPTSPITQTVTAGTHTLTMIGLDPGVELDGILLTTNTSCTPTGDGSNCNITPTPTPTPTPSPTTTYTPTPSPTPTGQCTVSNTLVNSCRPWLGAAVAGDPAAPAQDKISQFNYLEKIIGHPLDLFHDYHPAGSIPMNSDETHFANQAGTYDYINWKPASTWQAADGGNSSVNASIKQAADNIKAVAPHKVFLTVWHEPENDVSAFDNATEANTCKNDKYFSGLKGSAGTPNQYKAMWQNVRNIFNQQHVTNVVWVINYMNYQPWECVVPMLYPGNSLVDWVNFEAYPTKTTFQTKISDMYNLLQKDNTPTTNFESKPWGIGEFDDCQDPASTAAQRFTELKGLLDHNTFPRLKMYMVFDDANGPGGTSGCLIDRSPAELSAFKALANDPVFSASRPTTSPSPSPTTIYVTPSPTTSPSTSPKPPAPLAISLTSPTDGATVSGRVNLAASLTNQSGAAQVGFWVDGNMVASAYTAPYNGSWDSTTVSNGLHTITVTAQDSRKQPTQDSVSVYVENSQAPVPNAPTGVKAVLGSFGTSGYPVSVSWTAPTNTTPTNYYVVRNGVTIAKVTTTSYEDSIPADGQTYRYQVIAANGAGTSPLSAAATVTAKTQPRPTRPNPPRQLRAGLTNSGQVNLIWQDSDPNVTAFGVYRALQSNQPQFSKIATVTTASFGDASVSPGHRYVYYVTAEDAAGQSSDPSNQVHVTVGHPGNHAHGNIYGTVSGSHGAIVGAKITLEADGHQRTVTTQAHGQYNVTDLSPDTYRLVIRAPGYHHKSLRVTVRADRSVHKNIRLDLITRGKWQYWKHWDFWNYDWDDKHHKARWR